MQAESLATDEKERLGQAIERGEHAQGLNVTKLITSVPFPEDWAQQRQLLGMG